MNFSRGERFELALDQDDGALSGAPSAFNSIADIKERTPAAPTPPRAPTLKSTTTGFPAHKKRTRTSAFKQQRAVAAGTSDSGAHTTGTPPPATTRAAPEQPTSTVLGHGGGFEDSDRQRIDEENRQQLASMSTAEIEQEQKELLAGLSPVFLEKLLKKANINDGSSESEPHPAPSITQEHIDAHEEAKRAHQSKAIGRVAFAEPDLSSDTEPTAPGHQETLTLPPAPEIHFPQPPPPTEPLDEDTPLDPSSDTFLADLHAKYFPNTPHDPSKLAWLQPVDPSTSPYNPSVTSLSPSDIRFSFTGALIPPSEAALIPVTKGLHHHGDAPDAAGYTIPELAWLSRSRVAGQRCMAYQTLGRILYRLGVGEFGREGHQEVHGPESLEEKDDGEKDRADADSVLARGLWDCVEENRVLDTLMEEAGKEGGHLSAKSYAQEALWNWRRGGGRLKKAV